MIDKELPKNHHEFAMQVIEAVGGEDYLDVICKYERGPFSSEAKISGSYNTSLDTAVDVLVDIVKSALKARCVAAYSLEPKWSLVISPLRFDYCEMRNVAVEFSLCVGV